VRITGDSLFDQPHACRREVQIQHAEEIVGDLLVVHLVIVAGFPEVVRDRDGGLRLLDEALQRELPRMELIWADGAYTSEFRRWAEEERGWRVEVPHHRGRQVWRYGLEEKPRGFQVVPRRWVVERTFAWLGLSRRFSKDYERLPETGVAMIYGAMSRLMLRRLARAA
jgi:putative transposase